MSQDQKRGEARRLIHVGFSVPLPTHDSFEAAVNAVPRRRRDQASALNRRLRGASVESGSYDGPELSLRMDTGDVLVVMATEAGVDWKLDARPARTDDRPVPPEHVRIRFPQGLEYDWDWRDWLERIVGRQFRGIAPRETMLSLFVHDAPELLFSSLVNLENGDRFLFFSES